MFWIDRSRSTKKLLSFVVITSLGVDEAEVCKRIDIVRLKGKRTFERSLRIVIHPLRTCGITDQVVDLGRLWKSDCRLLINSPSLLITATPKMDCSETNVIEKFGRIMSNGFLVVLHGPLTTLVLNKLFRNHEVRVGIIFP